jgi:hypothetical protein
VSGQFGAGVTYGGRSRRVASTSFAASRNTSCCADRIVPLDDLDGDLLPVQLSGDAIPDGCGSLAWIHGLGSLASWPSLGQRTSATSTNLLSSGVLPMEL